MSATVRPHTPSMRGSEARPNPFVSPASCPRDGLVGSPCEVHERNILPSAKVRIGSRPGHLDAGRNLAIAASAVICAERFTEDSGTYLLVVLVARSSCRDLCSARRANNEIEG